MKMLLEAGLIHGDCMTVTGRTVAENLKDVPLPAADQDVVFPLSSPIAPPGQHIIVLRVSHFSFVAGTLIVLDFSSLFFFMHLTCQCCTTLWPQCCIRG
jgi:hypothetical protein